MWRLWCRIALDTEDGGPILFWNMTVILGLEDITKYPEYNLYIKLIMRIITHIILYDNIVIIKFKILHIFSFITSPENVLLPSSKLRSHKQETNEYSHNNRIIYSFSVMHVTILFTVLSSQVLCTNAHRFWKKDFLC